MGCQVVRAKVVKEKSGDEGWVVLRAERGGEDEVREGVPGVEKVEPMKWRWLIKEWPGLRAVSCVMVSELLKEEGFSFRLQVSQYRNGYFFLIMGVDGEIPAAFTAVSSLAPDQTPLTTNICHKVVPAGTPISSSPLPPHHHLRPHRRKGSSNVTDHTRHSIYAHTPPSQLLFTVEFDPSITLKNVEQNPGAANTNLGPRLRSHP